MIPQPVPEKTNVLIIGGDKAAFCAARAERAISLCADDTGVTGAMVKQVGQTAEIKAGAVILAAGGFQANPEWRTHHEPMDRGYFGTQCRGEPIPVERNDGRKP